MKSVRMYVEVRSYNPIPIKGSARKIASALQHSIAIVRLRIWWKAVGL